MDCGGTCHLLTPPVRGRGRRPSGSRPATSWRTAARTASTAGTSSSRKAARRTRGPGVHGTVEPLRGRVLTPPLRWTGHDRPRRAPPTSPYPERPGRRRLPGHRAAHARPLGRPAHLRALGRAAPGADRGRRERVRVLRRAAVRQRPAPLRPPAHRLRQGRGAPLPDHAGPPGRPPLRLGLPRPAGRDAGREGARGLGPGGHHRLRHRPLQRRTAAPRCCATPTSGSATSPARPAGSTSTTTTRPWTSPTWSP